MNPKLWIDGDSFPSHLRAVAIQAAHARRFSTIIVADRPIGEDTPGVSVVVVPTDVDAADRYILARLNRGVLVVARDIELVGSAAEAGAIVIDDHWRRYDGGDISERRSLHRFMASLREDGIASETGEVSHVGRSHSSHADVDRRSRSKGKAEIGRVGRTKAGDKAARVKAFSDALDRELSSR